MVTFVRYESTGGSSFLLSTPSSPSSPVGLPAAAALLVETITVDSRDENKGVCE
jgi:hypothetical protein